MKGTLKNRFLSSIILWGLLILSGSILISCKKTATFTPSSVIRDISYGPDTMNQLDLYLCENYDESTPLVILIHGGGWVTGDKSSTAPYAESFSENGIIAANVNFRYPNVQTGIHYQEVLEDLTSALEAISNLSELYHFRHTDFAMFGHSSGGHLSLLTAYRNNFPRRVEKVIAYDPVTDLTDTSLAATPGMEDLIRKVVGDTSIHAYRDASPLYQADSSFIPTLCFHGTRDDIFPYTQSINLIQKIDSLSIRSKLLLLINSSHLNPLDYPFIISETTAFIKTNEIKVD